LVTLAQVAAALGRPAERLFGLDRRPLQLAFLDRDYETIVVRDRDSGETLEATLDAATGEQADPAELRRRDREVAAGLGRRLSPELRELVLRHPELQTLHVAVTREGDPEPMTVRAGARELVALAGQPDVVGIELLEEPVILD
jgi:hypothetical protein